MIITHMSPFGDIYLTEGTRIVKLRGLKRDEFLQKLTELRISAPPELIKNPNGVPVKKPGVTKRTSTPSKTVGKRPSKTTRQPEGTTKAGWIVRDGEWVKQL